VIRRLQGIPDAGETDSTYLVDEVELLAIQASLTPKATLIDRVP
jgi:hypothetical protein